MKNLKALKKPLELQHKQFLPIIDEMKALKEVIEKRLQLVVKDMDEIKELIKAFT